MKKFFVCSNKEVIQMILKHGVTHVISLITENEKIDKNFDFIRNSNIAHLHIEVDDVDNPLEPNHPSMEMLTDIFDWVENADENSVFLVHCVGGISRSPAVLLGILIRELGIKKLENAFEILITLRPHCFPNEMFIELIEEFFNFKSNEVKKLCDRHVESLLIKIRS